MNDDIVFHYPPELMNLLIDTIPLLNRSKKGVLLFFHGAGVSKALLNDLTAKVKQDSSGITKFEIVRTVLTRLNAAGESMLRQRREVLKRVVEFEEFASCWPDDQLKARGLVASIRELVNAKDTITRINIEREREREEARKRHQQAQEGKLAKMQEKKAALANIVTDINGLFTCSWPQGRGKALESIVNRLFNVSDILVREAFTVTGSSGEGIIEQIDGAIELDGTVFLAEMKWWDKPLGKGEVASHLVSVFNRADVGGIFISASGYTEPAITVCRDALRDKVIVLCELREIIRLLEQELDMQEFLRTKIRAAKLDREPFLLIM
ncbi:MAG: hypothetical protein BWY76_02004 [bacterium ADurb.Bin429]|nr:MAG: hypothetical protein BWY76_02004 [bacterium ADurb.Bin429]